MNRLIAIAGALIVGLLFFFFLFHGGGADFPPGAKVFRFALEQDPPTLDPVMVTDVTSDGLVRKLYNTLVRLDAHLKLQPDLAEALPEWNPKDHSYTFKLRKDVRFHNGREMTAADVKYSWERLLDPDVSKRTKILKAVRGAKEKLAREASETSGLKVLDKYTFKVTLNGPHPAFLLQVAMICAAVVPKEEVDAAELERTTFSRRPVGTGPFRLARWRAGRKLVFKRHERYFGGPPPLDGLIYEIIPEPQARLDRFQQGELDVCDIPFGRFQQLRKEHPKWISTNRTLRTNYLGLLVNHKDDQGQRAPTEPLGTHPKLRQAINHAINRSYLCQTILEGRGTPAQSILPPDMPGHDPAIQGAPYDAARAKVLLAEAGFPGGAGLPSFPLYYRKNPDGEKIVLAIQDDLKAIGVKVELRSLEWGAFLKKIYDDPPPLFYLGWVADYPDPDNFLGWLFQSSQWGEAGNETRYFNPKVDALTEKAAVLMDPEERLKLYNQAEKIIVRDCPWVLLEWRINAILLQPSVRGVRKQLGPLDVGHGLNNVDFAKVDLQRPPTDGGASGAGGGR